MNKDQYGRQQANKHEIKYVKEMKANQDSYLDFDQVVHDQIDLPMSHDLSVQK